VSGFRTDTRDQVVDFVRRWSKKPETGAGRVIAWLDITTSKFYDRRERYGKVMSTRAGFPAISGWRIGRS
jgi:hypothetical protein